MKGLLEKEDCCVVKLWGGPLLSTECLLNWHVTEWSWLVAENDAFSYLRRLPQEQSSTPTFAGGELVSGLVQMQFRHSSALLYRLCRVMFWAPCPA